MVNAKNFDWAAHVAEMERQENLARLCAARNAKTKKQIALVELRLSGKIVPKRRPRGWLYNLSTSLKEAGALEACTRLFDADEGRGSRTIEQDVKWLRQHPFFQRFLVFFEDTEQQRTDDGVVEFFRLLEAAKVALPLWKESLAPLARLALEDGWRDEKSHAHAHEARFAAEWLSRKTRDIWAIATNCLAMRWEQLPGEVDWFFPFHKNYNHRNDYPTDWYNLIMNHRFPARCEFRAAEQVARYRLHDAHIGWVARRKPVEAVRDAEQRVQGGREVLAGVARWLRKQKLAETQKKSPTRR